eukprot:TRINITY_DN11430_c0_g1_i9.p1 TRINITY_DN11430_c0_g1~~TRINITY_DN11430_c0_g1_i9.p1  ORF type:complete len:459 (+),score=97.00 TRINITY_DN11430_c0_g1_i9:50-1426(+)
MIMIKTLFLASLLLATFARPRMTIWAPSDLVQKLGQNEVQMNLAHFGYIPWGRALVGHVYVADPIDACTTLPRVSPITGDRSPILLVKRGSCTFITKGYNGQMAGASMVVVIDDRDEAILYPEMVSDRAGFGDNIHIPIAMISKSNGEAILKVLTDAAAKGQKSPVALAIGFDWPRADRPSYEIWVSAADQNSYASFARFAPYAAKLFNSTDMNPRFVSFPCEACEKAGFKIANPDCLSGGRYCAADPDGTGPLSGRDIIWEQLRQICISLKGPEKFYEYALGFRACINKATMATCAEQLTERLLINPAEINSCIDSSWITFGGAKAEPTLSDNELLRKERSDFVGYGISHWPQVFINGMPFGGNMDEGRLFSQICHSFEDQPAVCTIPEDHPQRSADPNDYKPHGSIWGVVLIVAIFALVFMGAFYLVYRRVIKRELAKELSVEVNQAVSNLSLIHI